LPFCWAEHGYSALCTCKSKLLISALFCGRQ
jgi:hypothetical protein